jgi:hypothetical protein
MNVTQHFRWSLHSGGIDEGGGSHGVVGLRKRGESIRELDSYDIESEVFSL